MEIQQLKYFISVAKYQSFTKAAQECFVVQTTITHGIKKLEQELGFKLIERDKHSVRLTRAGQVFLEEANNIVALSNQAVERARFVEGEFSNYLGIGYLGHVCYLVFPDLLRHFSDSHPLVKIDLFQDTQTTLLKKLNENEIDCFFSTEYGALPSVHWLEKKKLFRDDHLLVVPKNHWAANRKGIHMSELTEEKFVMLMEPDLWEHEEPDKKEFLNSQNTISANSHDNAMLLVESGFGITICVAHAYINKNPNLVAIPLKGLVQKSDIFLCWKKENNKIVLHQFLALADEYDFKNHRWK